MKRHSTYRPTTKTYSVRGGDTVVADGDVYNVKSVTTTALVRLENRDPMGEHAFETILDEADTFAIAGEVSDSEFYLSLRKFQVANPSMASFVTIPVEGDNPTYYLAPKYHSGFVIDGDTLLALFNHTGPRGYGETLIDVAIAEGARTLMCFDTKLSDIYKRHGFVETDRVEWDEDLAPEDWDYEQFGRPDVVWMEYQS